jgi:hypothetical protein
LYQNKNSKIGYVVLFIFIPAEEVVDVTRRYTRKWKEVISRRTEVPEEWLLANLERINQIRLARIPTADVQKYFGFI